MRSCVTHFTIGLAGATLALASAVAHAAPVFQLGTQGPKPDLTVAAPPALSSDVASAQSTFNSLVTFLGRNEYEGGSGASFGSSHGSGNFNYTGGAATLTGGTIVNGSPAESPRDSGRYNMTAGVAIDSEVGGTGRRTGHWLESSSSFTYNFSSLISALAFFGTDFGDLRGSFTLTLFNDATQVFTSGNIINTRVDASGAGNGNLLFYGVVSDVSFNRAVFNITQRSGATDLDFLGFDSLIVGTAIPNAAPEPTSLALVGLALAGLGAVGAKRRQA